MKNLEKHIAHCRQLYSASRGFSSVLIDIRDFSCLDPQYEHTLMPNAKFPSVEYYPPCTKYSYPKKLRFIDPGDKAVNQKRIVVEVVIGEVLALDEDHFLNLHPIRYDRIKCEISSGHIYMPYIDIGYETIYPRITDGRHRTIALKSIGCTRMPVCADVNKIDELNQYLTLSDPKDEYLLEL